jgi:hypothetical protein
VITRWGEDAIERSPIVEWDVTPPKDRNSEAQAMLAAANALKALKEALELVGREVDVDAFAVQFRLPIKGDANGDGKPDAEQANLRQLPFAPAGNENDVPASSGEDIAA